MIEGITKGNVRNLRFLKGQAFLMDIFIFLTASMFVILLFVFMISITNNFRVHDASMQRAIENAADVLVSEGYPVNWEANLSNIHILGLANKRGKIDPSKLAKLNQTEYTELLSLNPYNISIKLSRDGNQVYSTGWYNSSANVAITERLVLYNNSVYSLRIIASEELQ